MRGTGPAQQPYAIPPPASPAAHPAAAAAAAAGGDAAPQAAPQPKRLRVGVPPQPATASHAATADPPNPSLPAVAPLNALSEAALLASQADMPAAAGQQPLPGGAGSPLPAPLALSLQALLARPSPHAASVPAAPSTQQRARGVHGRPGAAAGPRSEVPSAPDPNAHERQPAASTRRPAARQPRTPAAASGAAAAPSPAITLTLAPINTATPQQALLESRGSGGSSGSTRQRGGSSSALSAPLSPTPAPGAAGLGAGAAPAAATPRSGGGRRGGGRGRGGSGHSSALKQLTPEQKVERILEHHGQSFCEELQIPMQQDRAQEGLWQWLVASILFSARIKSTAAMSACKALFSRQLGTPEALRRTSKEECRRLLHASGYETYDEKTAGFLVEDALAVLAEYGGHLGTLREVAHQNPAQERALLKRFKGVGDGGVDIFFREAQLVWPELFPFADKKALKAARLVGLREHPQSLAELCGQDKAKYVRLLSGLVRIELTKTFSEF